MKIPLWNEKGIDRKLIFVKDFEKLLRKGGNFDGIWSVFLESKLGFMRKFEKISEK